MSDGLAQGPYVVARVGFEPTTFWTQGTEPPHPTYISYRYVFMYANKSDQYVEKHPPDQKEIDSNDFSVDFISICNAYRQ